MKISSKHLFKNDDIKQLHKRVLTSFVTALSILLNAIFVHYFMELRTKECPCAKDWRNPTLIFMFTITLSINILQLFDWFNNSVINISLMILNVLSTVIGITYLQKLYDVDCQSCSNSPVRFIVGMLLNYRSFVYSMIALFVIYEAIVLSIILARKIVNEHT